MRLIVVCVIYTAGCSEVADSKCNCVVVEDSNCSSDHSDVAGSSCSSNCSVAANSTQNSGWSAEKHCSEDMDCSSRYS